MDQAAAEGMSTLCAERSVPSFRLCISHGLSIVVRLCAGGYVLPSSEIALKRFTIECVAAQGSRPGGTGTELSLHAACACCFAPCWSLC